MSLYEVSERICRKLEVEAFLSAILWRGQGAKSLILWEPISVSLQVKVNIN